MVSGNGIQTDPAKTLSIATWPLPQNISQLRGFLELASYYSRFIKDFGKIASPMTAVLEKDKAFILTDEGKRAFTEILHFLTNPPILAYPYFSATFILDTDASHLGIGDVLLQKGKDELEHPIAYYSQGFYKHEIIYYVTRKELLAAIESMEHITCYLYGKKFVLRTDHGAIQWLKIFKEPTGQLARWLEKRSMFEFIIQHPPGKRHAIADGLSRIQHETEVLAVIKDNNNKINWP